MELIIFEIYTLVNSLPGSQYSPQYAANLPRGRMSPPTVRELTLPSSKLPAPAPQPRVAASSGAPGWSAVTHPTRRLPASPRRVDGSWLGGVPASSTPPANVTHNVAPTWAARRAGSRTTAPQFLTSCRCMTFVSLRSCSTCLRMP